jgi:hypothetical protein
MLFLNLINIEALPFSSGFCPETTMRRLMMTPRKKDGGRGALPLSEVDGC